MDKAALIRLQYRYLTTPPQELNDDQLTQAIQFTAEKYNSFRQMCPADKRWTQKCTGPTREKHHCAYEVDINNDFTKFCDCCEDCQDACYRET
jgi:hypothetical protein